MNCLKCDTSNAEDARFCQGCGEALFQTCSHCDTPNDPNAYFCKSCGSKLTIESERLQALQQSAPRVLQEKLHAAGEALEGERKPVTMLFADIVGSTAIAEKLDPEEWKEIVNAVHRRLGEAIYRYEGTIAQLLGDGVLAFFGAPIIHEDDPIRAVRAALDLQDSIGEYSGSLKGYVDNLQMRVGINTGEVVIGEIGTDLHVEYLAIGDAVNVAARLESAADPGSVLISAHCQRLIGEDFVLKDLGEIKVKGKARPVHAFEVLEAKGDAAPESRIEAEPTPYVGRRREVQTLQTALRSLCEGRGGIVAILGEAGIGKSRLLEEVRRHIAKGEIVPGSSMMPPSSILWLEGRGLTYGGSLSYWTITQLLLADLRLSDGAPEVKIKVALRKRMEELFGGEADEWFPYLAHLLGLTEDPQVQQSIRTLDGETVKRQTLLALSEYFQRVAGIQPTVLILEDMHWADPSSLEAYTQLLPLTDRASLLILMLMRIERDHGSWALKLKAETDYPHRYSEIHLHRLTDDQTDELVHHLLGVEDLPKGIGDLIRSRAEGNPYYLEEVTQHLMERGLIERVPGGWRATEAIEQVGVPETLQGVLLARIDRLEEGVRRTLQMASVIGKSFLYRILEAISDAERELDEHLSQLQRVDLVREKTRLPELEYMFKHSLTQEAAYNSLLRDRRREFHRKVGEVLEVLFPDRQEEFAGLIAHHFETAQERGKAVEYLLRAGDHARVMYAHEEGIDFYQRAISLLKMEEDYEQVARTLMRLGLTYHTAFDFERSRQAYNESFLLTQQYGGLRPPSPISLSPDPLRMCIIEPIELDPGYVPDANSAFVVQQIFSGLLEIRPDLSIVPDLASKWEVREDGQKIIFYLRGDARWTDGEPVKAQDYEFAWKRCLAPEKGDQSNARLLYDIKGAKQYHLGIETDPSSIGVRALDDLTLFVELEKPSSYFLHLLAKHTACTPVPAHIVRKHGDNWTHPSNLVTNGPFQLVCWERGKMIVLERNPNYAGSFRGNLQRVECLITSGDNDLELKSYEEDHLDFLDLNLFPPLNGDLLRQRYASEYTTLRMFGTAYLNFNHSMPPFNDKRVRQAFSMAIDRHALAEVGMKGFVSPATGGIVPAGMPGHSPGVSLPYDPERARQLLADAGYRGRREGEMLSVQLWTRDYGPYVHAVEHLISQLSNNLGINIEWKKTDWASFLKCLEEGSMQLLVMGWEPDYFDPDNFLRVANWKLRWEHEAFDAILETARQLMDQQERMRLYDQAERILAEEAPIIPFLYYDQHALVKSWVRRLSVCLRGSIFKDIIIDPH